MKNKLILCLVLCLVLLSGCTNKETKVDKVNITNEQTEKANEQEKLKNYLIEQGFIETENNCFKLTTREINDENGKPYNWDITYFYLDTLKVVRMTALAPVGINSTQNYSYLTDTSDGSYSYFSSSGELENIINYSYDFKTGTLSCSNGLCSTYQTTSQSSKQYFLSIIENASVKIDLLK